MSQDNHTDGSSTGDAHVTSADGGAAVDSSTLTLSELNQFLGKDFKDKDSALKSLKDTQSFVGKRKEDIEREVRATNASQASSSPNPELESKVRSLEEQVFYAQHPQFKGYEAIIKAMGSSPAEVVNTDAFKTVFEKGKVADEVARTKSVVPSNGRIGQQESAVQEAIKVANATGSTERTAEALAKAILAEGNQTQS